MTQTLDQGARIVGHAPLGAGYSDTRDGIDKALTSISDHFQPLVGAGRRCQEDWHQSVVMHLGQVFSGFLNNHVRDQHPVDPGMRCLVTEALQS